MTIENWPEIKGLSYDARQIFYHPGKTYNLIQCVEGFPTGSKRSRQMSTTKTICKGSCWQRRCCDVLDVEVENVFRHILLYLGPETTSFTASVKKN